MAEVEIGSVMEFFARPVVAGIELTDSIKVGDHIHVLGHTTDLELTVESIQLENTEVAEASPGQQVVKVSDQVRRGDRVYGVTD